MHLETLPVQSPQLPHILTRIIQAYIIILKCVRTDILQDSIGQYCTSLCQPLYPITPYIQYILLHVIA